MQTSPIHYPLGWTLMCRQAEGMKEQPQAQQCITNAFDINASTSPVLRSTDLSQLYDETLLRLQVSPYQSDMEATMYNLIIIPAIYQLHQNLESCPGNLVHKTGGHPGQGSNPLLSTITHTSTRSREFRDASHPTPHRFFFLGRKPEYPEEIPEAQEEHSMQAVHSG